MLARLTLPLSQSQCPSSLSLRAAPATLPLARALVVPRAAQSTRSSSPRSESWRSSWRTELEHGSNGNGNGNGAHVHESGEYQSTHVSNGNGYHGAANGFSWGNGRLGHDSVAAEQEAVVEEVEEDFYGRSSVWQSTSDETMVSDQAGTSSEAEEDDAEESSGGGFFTDAFKGALKAALQRSPLYADEYAGMGSADEENTEPQPYENEVEVYNRPIFNDQFRQVLKESLARQQAELDAYSGVASDDEYTTPAVPYVPAPPPRREMSPIEEIIATALGASQLHLRRLNLMKNEIQAAIERETKQAERLDFALNKARSDVAYYQTLEKMLAEHEKKRQ